MTVFPKLRRTTAPLAAMLLSAAVSGAALACDDDDADGLDVGLVLSGGGALATTHVGALAVVQALGVPIHCVVGTSMGSVVGALFAAGYDAEALKQVFRDSRWPEVFNDTPSRRDQPYLRKEQDDLYLSGYLAGWGPEGLRLPGGFRSMAGLKRLYRQLLVDVTTDVDFDDLPLPYRAVAMDLSTGEPVALARGDLVEAMLASMAVPGAFAPRHVDGRILVDGGMAAQLPVEVAREMGADVIIALDTTIEPPAATANWSAPQVSQQIVRLMVWNNWQRSRVELGEDDVMIQADLEGLTTSSFAQAEVGFASGERAARTQERALLAIRDRAAPTVATSLAPPIRPASLRTVNSSTVKDGLIERRFDYRPEDLNDPDRVQHKLRSLAAFGPFGETDLAVLDAETALLTTTPHPLGRNLLNLGVRASSNFRGDSRYGVLGRYSRRPLYGNGSELRVSAEIGSDVGVTAELYRPFGPESRFFVTPAIAYRGEELLLDVEDVRIGEFWQQTGEAWIRVGRELGDWGILAFDGVLANIDTRNIVTIVPVPESQSSQNGGYGVLFGLDTLNDADWPVLGVQMKASAHRLYQFDSDNDTTDRLQLKFIKPLGLGAYQLLLRGDTQSLVSDGAPVDILRLGGFRRMSSFPENSLLADRYAMGSLELFRRLNPSEALFSVPIYVGLLAEYVDLELTEFGPEVDEQFRSVAAYLGTDTALGPLYLGFGYGDDDSHSVFLHFGRTF